MQRDLYQNLIAWKQEPNRKPLLLQGARQTGKTYLLKEFGKNEYAVLHYFNFEEEPGLASLFASSLQPDHLITQLSRSRNREIRAGQDLLVLDEIQQCNNALNSLKYFCEEAPQYHVVAAGSLLGVKLSKPRSFPVGKVRIMTLHPMTFLEFLTACGESGLRTMLEQTDRIEPYADLFHHRLVGLLREYYYVGGMPEAVAQYAATRSLVKVREVQDDILTAYVSDFAKHAPVSDIPKLSLIWDSIPLHLSRENKKFVFSVLSQSARAREYENALRWLADAGLILTAHAVDAVQQPLAAFANRNAFKVYGLDTGLLGAQAKLSGDILTNGDAFFTTFHGAFAENYVAQQLAAVSGTGLYYWKTDAGCAELDFLVSHDSRIVPLEVKAGVNPKSKSLASYDRSYAPGFLARATLLNLRMDGRILNVPLYAVNLLARWFGLAASRSASRGTVIP